MFKAKRGFTLVELLIVIVIIAILAAITIVAYNGITNRANDVAVQDDLETYAKKAQLFAVDNPNYPLSATDLKALGAKASQGSYDTSYHNLYYCINPNAPTDFVFAGRSKSGTLFYNSSKGSGNLGNTAVSGAVICNTIGVTYPGTNSTVLPAYNSSNNTWQPWAS